MLYASIPSSWLAVLPWDARGLIATHRCIVRLGLDQSAEVARQTYYGWWLW
jgi:hypothetical protein